MALHKTTTFAVAVLLILAVGGCSLVQIDRGGARGKNARGVYHTVESGQTLWRICWTYGVDLDRVAKVNRIKDPRRILVGQKIFIPGAKRVRKVLPYAPPMKGKSALKGKRGKVKSGGVSKKAPPAKKGLFIWPVKGKLSSRFGPRSGDHHDGIDIAAKRGTTVRAAESGKVVYSDNALRGYGNVIIIEHRGGYFTIYAHNDKNLVKKGAVVKKGAEVAVVGKTGTASGFHLHFEIRYGGDPKNPLFYLP